MHFAKCEGILSFCEALSWRNNRNVKLSISFLAPSHNNIVQERKRFSKAFNLLTRSHHAITLPSQLSCSIPDIIYVSCFEFFIFLSHFVLYNCQNCQITKCQIAFSKVFSSVSNNKVFTGSHLNAANFYGTMLFYYTILCLKLDFP